MVTKYICVPHTPQGCRTVLGGPREMLTTQRFSFFFWHGGFQSLHFQFTSLCPKVGLGTWSQGTETFSSTIHFFILMIWEPNTAFWIIWVTQKKETDAVLQLQRPRLGWYLWLSWYYIISSNTTDEIKISWQSSQEPRTGLHPCVVRVRTASCDLEQLWGVISHWKG